MKHLRINNETYFSHLLFAGKVGISLIFRGVVFVLHGLLPFIPIPHKLNLGRTSLLLKKWNRYAEVRKNEKIN